MTVFSREILTINAVHSKTMIKILKRLNYYFIIIIIVMTGPRIVSH
jgi:hypothetical protein